MKMAKQVVMIFCAHPDDDVIGAGATMAKYTKEGKRVITIIFSYGEGSHPWLKKRVTAETRVSEAKKAGKILGVKEIIFLGVKDTQVAQHGKKLKIEKKIMGLIKKYNPNKIFTHSKDDPWPDHQAVYDIITKVLKRIRFGGDVYSFGIWNPFSVRERNLPKLVVDVSDSFKFKRKALACYESQKFTLLTLIPFIYSKAVINGINNNVRFAEVFYKIR